MIEIGHTVRLRGKKRTSKVQFIREPTTAARCYGLMDPAGRVATLSKPLGGYRNWPVSDLELCQRT